MIKAALIYGLGLIAIVAALVWQPFSTLLNVLLFAWLLPFYLIGPTTAILAWVILGHHVFRALRDRRFRKRPIGSMALWDRWLDGSA